jgi:hypothetical protein
MRPSHLKFYSFYQAYRLCHKKEDYINFLLPATNWNNNLFYLYNKTKLDILQHYTIYTWELSNDTPNKYIRRVLKTDSHSLLNSSWSFAIIVVSQYLEK